MKKILYQLDNGLVGIINPHPSLTEQELISQVPTGYSYILVEEDQMPSRQDLRDFSDALTADFNNPQKPNVRIDLEKAKEVTKNRLRYERKPLFEKNDILLRDAILENDEEAKKESLTERNRLRYLTDQVDYVETLQELRDIRANVESAPTYIPPAEIPPEILSQMVREE
jgi:hypothetical protein